MSARVPTSTYRIQFHSGFTFQQAADLVPYLHDLGISDLYASPILRSRSGSTHGYDVTDPTLIDPERGGEEAFARLQARLGESGMGLLVDVVPNHMAASVENPWFRDVLRHGPAAQAAQHFDIDWQSVDPEVKGRLLLPVVDGDPAALLDDGRIRLRRDATEIVVDVAGNPIPVDPQSLAPILSELAQQAPGALRPGIEQVLSLAETMPRYDEGAAVMDARRRATEAFDAGLATLLEDPEVAAALDAMLSGDDGAGVTARVMVGQPWVLADWRTAPQRVNYRRFFDINDLICLRVDDPHVFHETHARLLSLARSGSLTGLRIDHIDGLADPYEYLERLQETFGAGPARVTGPSRSDVAIAPRDDDLPFYVLVEKILVGSERLPPEWPVHGATGYESSALIEGLFVDATGRERLDDIYSGFIGERRDYSEVVHEAKHQVIQELFPGLFDDLARRLVQIIPADQRLEEDAVRGALEELAACFRVYRTYCRDGVCRPSDRQLIEYAVQEALRRRTDLERPLRAIQSLFLDPPQGIDPWLRADWIRRWQQTTGPVMAKGYEDTALYRYFSLISLNEVGDRPDTTTWTESFHHEMTERLLATPHALNASSTHDSKRSEDVRARLNALAEMPDEWATAIERFRAYNEDKKTSIDGALRPGTNMEYLLYETLVGAWPLDRDAHDTFPERIAAYMLKAAREAKQSTHWLHPDARYEEALTSFARSVAATPEGEPFRIDLEALVAQVAPLGMINSLAHLVLKCTTPGVPDIYQGQELWDLSLVDPDNRRPVDYPRRAEILQALHQDAEEDPLKLVSNLLGTWEDGRIKAYVTSRLLHLRRERPLLFARGEYIPVRTIGRWARHVVAFARHMDGAWALVAVPRSTRIIAGGDVPLGDVWEDTALQLPPGAPQSWTQRLTRQAVDADDGVLRIADLFAAAPVAVCVERQGPSRAAGSTEVPT